MKARTSHQTLVDRLKERRKAQAARREAFLQSGGLNGPSSRLVAKPVAFSEDYTSIGTLVDSPHSADDWVSMDKLERPTSSLLQISYPDHTEYKAGI